MEGTTSKGSRPEQTAGLVGCQVVEENCYQFILLMVQKSG